MSRIYFFTIVFAVTFITSTTYAVDIVIDGDVADTTVGLNAASEPVVAWGGGADLATGSANYDYGKGDSVAVLVFELPDLGGEAISSADLAFDAKRTWESVWNVDLYGTRSDAAASVSTADYGYGPTPGGTLIQDNILTPDHPNNTWAAVSTDGSGDTALAAWLTDQYTAVGAGGFVFLRFNSDDVTPQLAGDVNTYTVASANASTQATPVLTISTGVVGPDCATRGSEGDFNCDAAVGLLDLDILGTNWGATGVTYAEGDATGDGEVGLLDLDVLGQNWGQATSVPEPTCLGLIALGSLMITRRR